MNIAVVGAGIAGLAGAYELQRAGHDVIVFESSDQVGGRMATRSYQGLPFDIGANHLANVYSRMRKYCQEFNLPWLKMEFERYGVFHEGNIVRLGSIPTRWEKIRLAWAYWRTPNPQVSGQDFFDLSTLAQFDRGDADSRMERTLGRRLTNIFVDSFTSTYQFHRAEELSYAAVIGMLQSQKFHADDWRLYRLTDGMSTLPEAFAKQLNVRLNSPVQVITPLPTGGVMVETAAGKESFDTVVLACPAPIAKQIYPMATPTQQTLLAHSAYATTVAVAFKMPQNTMADYSIVWVPYSANQHISGYTNEYMKGVPMLCVWLHEAYAKTLIDLPDEQIYTIITQELKAVAPWFTVETQIEPLAIQRWPQAMPKFSPEQISRVADFITSPNQGAQQVWLCGDYLNSPWTEGALRCGERVAQQIIAAN